MQRARHSSLSSRCIRFGVALSVAAIAAGAAASVAPAARVPTYIEKVTIMDAFNIPGRSWPSRCVKIRVSTVDSRYALVTSRAKPPQACARHNDAGNGFAIFKRETRTAVHWADIYEGEGMDHHVCSIPAAVRHDLLRGVAPRSHC
jgi:hypothetical protein